MKKSVFVMILSLILVTNVFAENTGVLYNEDLINLGFSPANIKEGKGLREFTYVNEELTISITVNSKNDVIMSRYEFFSDGNKVIKEETRAAIQVGFVALMSSLGKGESAIKTRDRFFDYLQYIYNTNKTKGVFASIHINIVQEKNIFLLSIANDVNTLRWLKALDY